VRGEWEREWCAELWHLHHELVAEGRPSAGEQAALVLRSAGSIFDALQLRVGDAHLWGESFASVAARWGRHARSVTLALLFLSLGIAAVAVLIAVGQITVELPRTAWSSLATGTRFAILGIAIGCGVSMIAASAAAAAQLLGSPDPPPDGPTQAWVTETLLVAGVTGWVGRWFAAFGMRSAVSPPTGEWPASVDPGAAVTAGWAVAWLCALTVLTALRASPRTDGAVTERLLK
jgi:hypothetical protein